MYDRLLNLLSEVVTSKTLGLGKNKVPIVQSGQDAGEFYRAPEGSPDHPPIPSKKIQGPSVTAGALRRGAKKRKKK